MKLRNKYFLLRHGESLRNKKDIAVCWPEKIFCPLTKKGEKQTREATRKLKNKKISLIFCSDLLRTKQTAKIVAEELGLKAECDKRLREINVGIFNGKPLKEVRKFWGFSKTMPPFIYQQKRYHMAPPGGENYFDVERRLDEFLKEKEKKYKRKNILIVSHERPLTILEKIVRGYDLKKFAKFILEKKYLKTGQVRAILCR